MQRKHVLAIVATLAILANLFLILGTSTASTASTEPKRRFVVLKILEDERPEVSTLYLVEPINDSYILGGIYFQDGWCHHMEAWEEPGRICADTIEILPASEVELILSEIEN